MSTEAKGPDRGKRLRISFRKVQKERVGDEAVLTVFCPSRNRAVPLLDCRSCDNFNGLSIDPSDRNTFLRCACGSSTDGPPVQEELESSPGLARHVPVSRVMTSKVRCASPDMDIESLTRLFLESGISAVPVVDGDGRAIGVVSKTDVLRAYYEGDEDQVLAEPAGVSSDEVSLDLGSGFHIERMGRGTVAEVMTHLVFEVTEDTSLSRAAALMSYEGVHRVVVTAPNGAAVGIVSSLDILRWLARSDGYLVPEITRQQID